MVLFITTFVVPVSKFSQFSLVEVYLIDELNFFTREAAISKLFVVFGIKAASENFGALRKS